ncbi:MAG: MFS transporter [Deltaproteobacteria bacterium]|nr:MFS transporter [Deltaproteobacteria bacterium]
MSTEPDRAEAVDRQFAEVVSRLPPGERRAVDLDAPVREGARLTARGALDLFDAQVASRHLDLAARALRARERSYYTIGSSGHEGNAAVARALRVDDPAFLHYRSGAFFLERARMAGYPHGPRDVLLGVVASREEPIAGGRHKVFGSKQLHVPPQTSTIASHPPKAMGMALALGTRKNVDPRYRPDAIVLCSFGDASANHSTALGAIHTASCLAFQRLPVPVLFVCEDNGLGISVPTPPGWIEASFGNRPGLRYFRADGLDVVSTYEGACAAVEHVRASRSPAFLHLRTVRLMGHAGADQELAYRSLDDIRATEAQDPLLSTARLLVEAGAASPAGLLARYEEVRRQVRALAEQVTERPRLRDAADVMSTIAAHTPDAIAAEVARPVEPSARARFFGDKLPEDEGPLTLSVAINRALGDLLVKYAELRVFGEDVGHKGGVYGVTRGLIKRAGVARVFDTLLDEQSILGFAIGAGHAGLLPIAEIQYLAYLHNAEDQLRGEAATLSFFSQGQYRNPMVVRVAGYGYQKGFGGHFHNDNAIGVLRDIPGIVIASPSRPDDAAAMLHTCVAAAKVDGAVCVFLEPIALYNTRDLHAPKDGEWLAPYPRQDAHVPIGKARTHGDGRDLLLVSFANGVAMSLRVARRLEASGIRARVLDLRWLAPLPIDDLLREANEVGRVLIVDETRRTGGVSEGVVAALVDAGFRGPLRRVASKDSFIPLGPAAELVLLSEAEIEAAARALLEP